MLATGTDGSASRQCGRVDVFSHCVALEGYTVSPQESVSSRWLKETRIVEL